jgi:hypothetical protein
MIIRQEQSPVPYVIYDDSNSAQEEIPYALTSVSLSVESQNEPGKGIWSTLATSSICISKVDLLARISVS